MNTVDRFAKRCSDDGVDSHAGCDGNTKLPFTE